MALLHFSVVWEYCYGETEFSIPIELRLLQVHVWGPSSAETGHVFPVGTHTCSTHIYTEMYSDPYRPQSASTSTISTNIPIVSPLWLIRVKVCQWKINICVQNIDHTQSGQELPVDLSLPHVAATWTQEVVEPQPHSRRVQNLCTHCLTHALSLTHTHTYSGSRQAHWPVLFTHSWPFYPLFPEFSLFGSLTALWSLPVPPFFSPSPKQAIINPIQSQNTFPMHPIMCPWADRLLSMRCFRDRLPWLAMVGWCFPGAALGPWQECVSPLKLFGSSVTIVMLRAALCVETSLLSLSLTNTCFLWDFFVAWVGPSLSQRHIRLLYSFHEEHWGE